MTSLISCLQPLKNVESSFELDSQDIEPEIPNSDTQISVQQRTPQQTVDKLRKRIISSLSDRDGISLIAHKRVQFWTPDHNIRVACAISKRYDRGHAYWYAYHQQWNEFLEAGDIGYYVLGCIDKETAYVLPHAQISKLLPNLIPLPPQREESIGIFI